MHINTTENTRTFDEWERLDQIRQTPDLTALLARAEAEEVLSRVQAKESPVAVEADCSAKLLGVFKGTARLDCGLSPLLSAPDMEPKTEPDKLDVRDARSLSATAEERREFRSVDRIALRSRSRGSCRIRRIMTSLAFNRSSPSPPGSGH